MKNHLDDRSISMLRTAREVAEWAATPNGRPPVPNGRCIGSGRLCAGLCGHSGGYAPALNGSRSWRRCGTGWRAPDYLGWRVRWRCDAGGLKAGEVGVVVESHREGPRRRYVVKFDRTDYHTSLPAPGYVELIPPAQLA